jgi:hypothetical protein
MALRTDADIKSQRDWKKFFSTELELDNEIAKKYADVLYDEGYCRETICHLFNHSTPGVPPPSLLELGIKAGHCLKMALHFTPDHNAGNSTSRSTSKIKVPRPVLTLDVNQVDFDQFCFEWKTYRMHYNITGSDISSQLFYCGNEDVRRRIRIEEPEFITPKKYSEPELLNILKDIVLSKISRIVHIKQFHDLCQKSNEPCTDFLSRLQTKASCCGFACTSCGKSSAIERIKEQFIVGLDNEIVHRAIIKTESVEPGTSLQQLLAEAVTLEQSMKDQETLKRQPEKLFSLDSTSSCKENDEEVHALTKNYKQSRNSRPCSGCGNLSHSSFERESKCPAWGKNVSTVAL